MPTYMSFSKMEQSPIIDYQRLFLPITSTKALGNLVLTDYQPGKNESKQLKIYLQITGNEKRQMVVMRGKYE